VTVSAISQVTQEGYVEYLSSFSKSGVMHLAWTTQGSGVDRILQWKPHTSGDFTEVAGATQASFHNVATIYVPSSNAVVAVFDVGGTDLYVARFDETTGATLALPTRLGVGMKPSILYRGGVQGPTLEMVYGNPRLPQVYLRESLDGGVTWSGERPVLSNYVRNTVDIAAVPFDDTHVSVLQLGNDARPMLETGSYTRTRPVAGILKHPTLPDQFYVVEGSNRGTRLGDYVRGAVLGSSLKFLDGDRYGSDDGLGPLSLFSGSGLVPTVVTAQVAGAALGDVVGPAQAADLALGPTYLYAALYSDAVANQGTLYVAPIAGGSSGTPITGIAAVHAVSVSNGVLFVATLEGTQEKLRIFTENGLTPIAQTDHKMPARVNKLLAVMSSPSVGYIYVSMLDRFNVYRVEGLTSPIRMVMTTPVLSRGSFFQAKVLSTGNILVAMGDGGIIALTPEGGVISETVLTGKMASPWVASKVYALNDIVAPTSESPYAQYRRYFRCSVGGTSYITEPLWSPSGTVIDNTAQWVEVGSVSAIITGLEVDESRSKIFAVGVVGGSSGTSGRVYCISAPGVVPANPIWRGVGSVWWFARPDTFFEVTASVTYPPNSNPFAFDSYGAGIGTEQSVEIRSPGSFSGIQMLGGGDWEATNGLELQLLRPDGVWVTVRAWPPGLVVGLGSSEVLFTPPSWWGLYGGSYCARFHGIGVRFSGSVDSLRVLS
jgi:hypothetical protein